MLDSSLIRERTDRKNIFEKAIGLAEVLRWQYEEVLLCLTFCARAAAQLAAGAGEAAGDAAEQVLPSPPGAEQSELGIEKSV